jgi:hypothetical protein
MQAQKIGIAAIVRAASRFYDMPMDDIKGRCRSKQHTYIRKASVLAARESANVSLIKMAAVLQRDHTTILYLLRSGKELADKHPPFRREVDILKKLAVTWAEEDLYNTLTWSAPTCYNDHDVSEKGLNDGETRLDR